MEQEEAVRVLAAGPGVERLDAGARAVEDASRHPAASASVVVREVAEDREVDARIEVAQREHLEVLEQRVHARRRWSAASGR